MHILLTCKRSDKYTSAAQFRELIMTKEDVLMALRLTAMGRANHELQERFAEEFAALTTPKQEITLHLPDEPKAEKAKKAK